MDDDGNIKALRKESDPKVEILKVDKLDKSKLVRPFEIVGGVLYRVEIYETKSDNYLFLDFHHILFLAPLGNSFHLCSTYLQVWHLF